MISQPPVARAGARAAEQLRQPAAIHKRRERATRSRRRAARRGRAHPRGGEAGGSEQEESDDELWWCWWLMPAGGGRRGRGRKAWWGRAGRQRGNQLLNKKQQGRARDHEDKSMRTYSIRNCSSDTKQWYSNTEPLRKRDFSCNHAITTMIHVLSSDTYTSYHSYHALAEHQSNEKLLPWSDHVRHRCAWCVDSVHSLSSRGHKSALIKCDHCSRNWIHCDDGRQTRQTFV